MHKTGEIHKNSILVGVAAAPTTGGKPLKESAGLVPDTQYDLVVLAASAGGLQAILEVLRTIPANFPAAVIFLQHLVPDRPSHLGQILARSSLMTVHEAADQDALHAGSCYVAPPDRHLGVSSGGVMSLSQEPAYHFHRPSADWLLESAAASFGPRLVAVILSGMGNDGSVGIRAVKAAGGMVIAEDPHGALFSGMPEAAVQTGLVDLILPIGEIGPRLVQIVRVNKAVSP